MLQQTLEQWISGPAPIVTVSNLGIQLRLDRSCPLYTTLPTSDECLDPLPTSTQPDNVPDVVAAGSSNGGAVAGALIGGVLLGVILIVGIGSVILLLLWWRQRGSGDKKAQMMKKVEGAKRYIRSTENLHQESTDDAGYEPIAAYIKDGSGHSRARNTYKAQADDQDAAKHKKRKKNSDKNSGKKVMEDESGYVVPDILWEGKQRPVAPGSAASAGKSVKTTSPGQEMTAKVEYDVPEGIEHRDKSKVKGQGEPQSIQPAPTGTLGQKAHVQWGTPTGKDHQKQKLQAKEASKTVTSQPAEQSQNNKPKKSVAAVQGEKSAKKDKPILHKKKESSSKLALQYQSNTPSSSSGKAGAGVVANTQAPKQDHTAVKSKLQNLLTPSAASPQPATKASHAKLSKKPTSSAAESAKVVQQQPQQQQQEPQQTSKVMAMAQKLQGAAAVGHTRATAGPETTDSKGPGAKKKYVLHVYTHITCMHGV